MPTCDRCGESVALAFNCSRCGGGFCGPHRMPENHNCQPNAYREVSADLRDNSITRRKWLSGVALGTLIGAVGYAASGQVDWKHVGNRTGINTSGVDIGNMTGFSSPTPTALSVENTGNVFSSYGWTPDGRFRFTIRDAHNLDFWGIRYAAKDDPEYDIVQQQAPAYGKTITVDLLGAMASAENRLFGPSGTPPIGRYRLIGYEATNLGEKPDTKGVSFRIEPELVMDVSTLTEAEDATLTLKNVGNAPVLLRGVRYESNRVGTTRRLNVRQESTIAIPPSLFDTGGDCYEVPTEAMISIATIPSLDRSLTLPIQWDGPRRVCEISV